METADLRAAGALLTVLRTHVSIEECALEGQIRSGCKALVFTLHVESDAAEQRRVRVALDVLHTLWIVDRNAWRLVMRKALGVKIPSSLGIRGDNVEAPLTVVVSVKHDKFPRQVNRARWQALLDPMVRLTEDEARVKRQLIQTYAHQRTAQELKIPTVPMRLQFLVFGMATSVVTKYVTRAVDMVVAVRDHLEIQSTDRALDYCAPFTLDSLELNLSPYEMTGGIARQVMRLHSLGVPFHCLHLRIIHHEPNADGQEEDTADRDQLLTVLLSPVDGESATRTSRFPIETLVLDRADLVQFRAACTALATTQRVKILQLQNVFTFDTPADRTLKWEWLTRALFSPSSQTSIKHLCINQTDIEFTDVEAVARTLQEVAEQSNGRNHALETLAIVFEASHSDTLDAIPLLLGLIGQHIEALAIQLWLGTVTQDMLVETLRACPNLRVLDLSSVELDSMDVFLDAYEHNNCQIRSLSLHQADIPSGQVTAFARVLRDPSRVASRVLRELCLDCVGEVGDLDQANLDAFHSVLEEPSSLLEYLELRVPETLLPQNKSRFRAHNNSWGPGVAALLPLACKAAFLSACRPRFDRRSTDDKIPPLAVGKLDHHVLSLIFQFAAARSRRNVFVEES